MCDNLTSNEALPTCPCGGNILLEDNEAELTDVAGLLIWGVCQTCGKTGPRFAYAEDAMEEAYNWK